jgi:cytochrome oxidase Cu insertion factor (SCO1/SenC/PrrC family)
MTTPEPKPRSIKPLLLILFVSVAPVILAFIVYYNPSLQPGGSTNYGTLVDPQRPLPSNNELQVTTLEGKPFDLDELKGQWLLIAADQAACPEECAKKLFILRNVHAMTGKNVKRVSRVWFVTDDAPVPQKVLDAYAGTIMLRADPKQLDTFLTGHALDNQDKTELLNPIWMVDPLGNLMMQYPKDPDPLKVRKDLGKLLHNSQIG